MIVDLYESEWRRPGRGPIVVASFRPVAAREGGRKMRGGCGLRLVVARRPVAGGGGG
jgi:hypothetical protein